MTISDETSVAAEPYECSNTLSGDAFLPTVQLSARNEWRVGEASAPEQVQNVTNAGAGIFVESIVDEDPLDEGWPSDLVVAENIGMSLRDVEMEGDLSSRAAGR